MFVYVYMGASDTRVMTEKQLISLRKSCFVCLKLADDLKLFQ